jgi:RNA polymerase sigma factor (sigma-70 family)
MDAEESITRLIGLAKVGEPLAIERLWNAYFHRLVAFARKKLDAVPNRSADEEDMAISAFKSFWLGVRDDRFPKVTDRSSLWPLLVAITSNKCIDHVRRQNRQKRGGTHGTIVGIEEIISSEPDPQMLNEVADRVEHLLQLLDATGDAALRRIATMRLHGHTTSEIAVTLDCAKRTVERKIGVIELCWAQDDSEIGVAHG